MKAGEGPTRRSRALRSYGSLAWCYDEAAALYSLGRISKARRAHLAHLRPGRRVLYAGVGRGSDALVAAQRGADVTCLDISQRMLRRLERRFAHAGFRARTIHADFFDHHPAQGYDAVVANFVLDVFDPARMHAALAHLAGLVRGEGALWIADFAPPTGPAWHRALCHAHYWPLGALAWLLGFAALHPIYDYSAALVDLDFAVVERQRFAAWPGGPVLYESLRARPHPS